MKSFAVIGLGRFGANLAITLENLGHEVLGVDNDPDKVKQVSSIITHAAIADPLDENVLKNLGIKNFDCAIVALSQDIQSSVLVTLSLKEMGVNYVLAKAQSDIHERVLLKVGADKVVFPEKDMGERVAKSLSRSNIIEYIQLSDEYSIIEIKTPHKWIGKSLRELNVRSKYKINIVAIKDADGKINLSPNPDDQLSEQNMLVIVGDSRNVAKVADGK